MVKNAENWQKTWVSDIPWDEWDAIFEYCYPVRVKLKSAIPLCSKKNSIERLSIDLEGEASHR